MLSTQPFNFTPGQATLAVALELSSKSWKIGLNDGQRAQPSIRNANHEEADKRLAEVVAVIEATKLKWSLPIDCTVVVMYEAGQDGFWIARAFQKMGYQAMIVDPASIPVERRARRAKTDRLDVMLLVNSLLGYLRGELNRMHEIRIPSQTDESQRHLSRERGLLQKESQQHRDRMRKLLRTVGCWDGVSGDFEERLQQGKIVCHDGSALPQGMRERCLRECVRKAEVEAQLAILEASLAEQLAPSTRTRITQLQSLKAVGKVGATRLVLELFWRHFNNRREVGACVGLVPQPYDSGNSHVDQGISKQGNRRVRALLIEMAWMWLRYQPDSKLSRWYFERTKANGPNKRAKRIAIVAVARRLAIDLWRYLEHGVVPDGAALK